MSKLLSQNAVKFPGKTEVMITGRSASVAVRNNALSILIPVEYADRVEVDDESFFLKEKDPELHKLNPLKYEDLFFTPFLTTDFKLKWAVQKNIFKVKTAWVFDSFGEAVAAMEEFFQQREDGNVSKKTLGESATSI